MSTQNFGELDMRMQKLIGAGFAAVALTSAAVPAFAYSVWPDIDFEWYADVGKPLSSVDREESPAPRAGYIWAPGRYELVDGYEVWAAGHWVKDDFAKDVAAVQTAAASTPSR
jgi:hypothetical protein